MYARVAVALPVDKTFLYALPEEMVARAREGSRVLVPFGRRKITGYIIKLQASRDGLTDLKQVEELLDQTPMFSPTVLALAQWSADYYMSPPGEMLRAALPAGINVESKMFVYPGEGARERASLDEQDREILRLLEGKKRLAFRSLEKRYGGTSFVKKIKALEAAGLISLRQELGEKRVSEKYIKTVSLSDDRERIDRFLEKEDKRLSAQIRIVRFLRLKKTAVPKAYLISALGVSSAPVNALVRKGFLTGGRIRAARISPAALFTPSGDAPIRLSADQNAALDTLKEKVRQEKFSTLLLHGVTGSGKTEVYLRTIEYCVSRGRTALYLVPEIGLTPVLESLLKRKFGESVGVFHSGLGPGERYDQWWRIRMGEARVVAGTRSAIFSPLENLGVIIVDEEQDMSYKQAETPSYHARDLAVVRGRMEQAVVILGSATPSMETYANALSGKYEVLKLPTRISNRSMARVKVVDMRAEFKKEKKENLFSGELREAIAKRHEKGEQVILLLNRRGFSSFVLCRECVQPVTCTRCSVNLAYHYFHNRLICHHCGRSIPVPRICSHCGSTYLTKIGSGTEKIERQVHDLFPDMKTWRMDRDSTGQKGTHDTILSLFGGGATDILVGTQMVAKGHDFPNVTLVGVLNADLGLGIPDFRAPERTFQLLTQVAGRSGRGKKRGEVIIQTYYPDHFSIRLARTQDFDAYYHEEIRFRRIMKLPPYYALVNIIITGHSAEKARKNAVSFRKTLVSVLPRSTKMLGPAPAPLYKLRNLFRYQILVKDNSKIRLRECLRKTLEKLPSSGPPRKDLLIDIDPYHLM